MTTYYVSTKGSDSGNGTSGSPWKTISKAMKANLKPGDEVVVRSGTYKEVGRRQQGRVAGPHHAALGSAGRCQDRRSRRKSYGINVAADYVKVDGFEVYGSTTIRYHRQRGSITSRLLITYRS